jgi:hypothetical protein
MYGTFASEVEVNLMKRKYLPTRNIPFNSLSHRVRWRTTVGPPQSVDEVQLKGKREEERTNMLL